MQYGQIDAPKGSFRFKVKKVIGEEDDPDFCEHDPCVVHIALEGLKLLDDRDLSRYSVNVYTSFRYCYGLDSLTTSIFFKRKTERVYVMHVCK